MLKLHYLLSCVPSADLAVGHSCIFGGGEVVEGFLLAGFLQQRQGGVAWTGALMKAHRNMEVVVPLWLLVYLRPFVN